MYSSALRCLHTRAPGRVPQTWIFVQGKERKKDRKKDGRKDGMEGKEESKTERRQKRKERVWGKWSMRSGSRKRKLKRNIDDKWLIHLLNDGEMFDQLEQPRISILFCFIYREMKDAISFPGSSFSLRRWVWKAFLTRMPTAFRRWIK